MTLQETIRDLAADAEKLEQVYQEALSGNTAEEFKAAIDDRYAAAPDNLLYAAWYYRLRHTADLVRGFAIAWAWVLPLALVNGLLLWWFSDDRYTIEIVGARPEVTQDFLPVIFLLAAPLSAVSVLAYFAAVAGNRRQPLGGLIGTGLLAAAGYVLWLYPQLGTRPFQEQYLTLMLMHLPLLAWTGVGVYVLAGHQEPRQRFAFLIKSLEVFVMGGLFVIAGGLFTAITVALFDALDVQLSEAVVRLFVAGGAGLIPVIAVAVIYSPTLPPAQQSFGEGLGKLLTLLLRTLLPLTLLVLLVYVGFIPFNFWAPFENRDVLITYNGMLFAVVALLVGATPHAHAELSPRLARWLRAGIVAVAALALAVSLYALAAILYRTALDRLTPNRLTFIGWNMTNIVLLALLLFFQARAQGGQWVAALYRAYSAGAAAYAGWTVVVILALPWVFGIDARSIQSLPPQVQAIVYEQPDPILLKCAGSPHIYLLAEGEKRWVKDIATFTAQGYAWSDVEIVSCADLRSIPDGPSIPANAGPPPTP